MLLAARNAMLTGCDKSQLGSVRFFGTSQSYLFHTFAANNPSVYTVSIWAKTTSAITHGCLVKIGRTNHLGQSGSGYAVGFGNTRFESGNDGSNLIALAESVAWGPGTTISTLDTWSHYVIVVNSSLIQVYRNGVLIYTWSSPSVYYFSPWTVYIGGYNDSVQPVNRQLACYVTRCAMWSRNLSSSEIVADYNVGNSNPDSNGLEHFWPLATTDDYLTDTIGSATLQAASDGVEVSTDTPF